MSLFLPKTGYHCLTQGGKTTWKSWYWERILRPPWKTDLTDSEASRMHLQIRKKPDLLLFRCLLLGQYPIPNSALTWSSLLNGFQPSQRPPSFLPMGGNLHLLWLSDRQSPFLGRGKHALVVALPLWPSHGNTWPPTGLIWMRKFCPDG